MTSRRAPSERDFPARFDKCENFLENLSFYTFSLALKFLHKESSECSYDWEDSEICFIWDYDVEVEDGFESANDTDSNESQSKKWQMQMNL